MTPGKVPSAKSTDKSVYRPFVEVDINPNVILRNWKHAIYVNG